MQGVCVIFCVSTQAGQIEKRKAALGYGVRLAHVWRCCRAILSSRLLGPSLPFSQVGKEYSLQSILVYKSGGITHEKCLAISTVFSCIVPAPFCPSPGVAQVCFGLR